MHACARALSILVLLFALPGAWPTDFAQPRPALHAGGQPTKEDLAALRASGVTTVIDLRAAGEDRGFDEPAEVERLGMRYIALPIGGKDDLTPANARALHQLLQRERAGVLLHCASGNRVGALLALGAVQEEGQSVESALALGRAAGLKSLEPAVRNALSGPAKDSGTPDK